MSGRRGFKTTVRDLLRGRGYDIVRFTRMQLIEHQRIGVVLDVGANTGQFAKQIQRLGYRGRIVSFEPVAAAAALLQASAAKNPLWEVHQLALGDVDQTVSMNVSKNLVSSSILQQRPALGDADPTSRFFGTEIVKVATLDGLFDDLVREGERVLLKIDTQGYERQVLQGAESTLPRIVGLHLEVSLIELYEGEFLLLEAMQFLEQLGYHLASLEPSLPDPSSGQLLQVDLTLFR